MRRICLAGLMVALLVAGCSKRKPEPVVRVVEDSPDRRPDPRAVVPEDGKPPAPAPLAVPPVVDSLPEPNRQERYEQALLEAVDFLAEKKYAEALAALEKAQKLSDTGTVQREIDKVRAVLAQQAAADRAVQDVKTVLDDGKAAEAAKLAEQALASHGGGDKAEDLARLKQQADAVVTAAVDDGATRRAALEADAARALKDQNLRAAAVALEQALALQADARLSTQLDDLRGKLKVYDDNRALAAPLRREPTRLEEGLAYLRKARGAWDTLEVRQEIDEFTLILERRRDRVGVADFEVRGDVGVVAAGRTVADELLPHFRPRFDAVERSQLNRLLDELKLEASDLTAGTAGRELGRLAKVRYLVVGSITPLAGVTVQARLVEVATGLVVQTARVSAPDLERLLPQLRQVALLLQMTDEQKLAYEARCAQAVEVIRPIAAEPLEVVPPPPPDPAPAVVAPAPIVTFSPCPPALGGLVIADFGTLLTPVVVAPPPPPPAAALVITGPRRNRLLRLSLELGDNLFRRGRCREAERHFALALTLAGPRREISLRLDACRRLTPPPPPVVVVPPRPTLLLAPPRVVVMAPARPRLALFGFVHGSELVPAAMGDWAADSFAPYLGGNFELIDRGEVCWYMGRLGVTLRDLLAVPDARLALARALNARFFVFGTIVPTASFKVDTHLVDAETGARTGTASLHVKDQQELKLRLHELAHQMGVKPDEQKKLAAQGAATEKALNEARRLLSANEPGKAADAARAGLKEAPNNVALRALLAQAQQKERLASFEETRRKEASQRALALQQAKKRQEELAQQAAAARARAEAEARTRSDAARKQLQAQKERAAEQLRKQAKAAGTKGDHARAVQLLQSSVALKPDSAAYLELGQARAAAEKERQEVARIAQEKRTQAQAAQRAAAQKRTQADKDARAKADAERRKTQAAHDQALHDGLVKQAQGLLAKKDFTHALAAAQSARKVKASDESTRLVQDAQKGLVLAEAEKKSAAERQRAAEELKKRQLAEVQQKKNQDAYLAALKKGQEAVQAKRYDEAVAQYAAALKLFRSDAAQSGLKAAQALRDTQQKALADQKAAKVAGEKKAQRLKELLGQGQKALAAKQHAKAVDLYRQATQLVPGSAEALAGLSRAEHERDAEADRLRRAQADKDRKKAFDGLIQTAKGALAKNNKAGAEKVLVEALKLYPDNAEAKALLAKAKPADPAARQREEDYKLAMGAGLKAMKEKKYQGALNSYNEALRLKKDDPAAVAGRNQAKKLLDDEQARAKEAAYQNALKQGQAAMNARKYADAVRAYDEALKVKPGDQAAINGKKAALAAQKPAPLKPKPPVVAPKPMVNTQAEYTKAMQQAAALEKQKKYADAVTAYQRALKLVPGDPNTSAALKTSQGNAYLGVARNEHAARRYAEAVKAYEEVLKRIPSQPEAKAALPRAKANKP